MMFSFGKEPWLKNYEFFKKQLPALMKTNCGQFAVVHNKKILEIFVTEEQAMEYVEEQRLENGSFLVQEITERVEYISSRASI